jgi:hypothetical protein
MGRSNKPPGKFVKRVPVPFGPLHEMGDGSVDALVRHNDPLSCSCAVESSPALLKMKRVAQ